MKPEALHKYVVKPLIDAQRFDEIGAAINAATDENPAAYARDVLGFSDGMIEMFQQTPYDEELLLQIRFYLQECFDPEYTIALASDKIEQLLNEPEHSRYALAVALRVADPFIDELYGNKGVLLSYEADSDSDLRLVQGLAAKHYEKLMFLRDHCLHDLAALTIDAIRNLLTADAIDNLCVIFDVRRDNHPSSADALAHWLMNRYHKDY